ncbi:hypothetical protein AGOR_G00187090 [Albula goreensis]|uniref:Butyrophilin subfamily 1 member A1-like n=1 Tax=Albula goreensis TaxID=1534307 RepID=A0A8T3CWG7_9TELE|nr:hypothetical protein AGOR_G00187090 [Albula goreensis]
MKADGSECLCLILLLLHQTPVSRPERFQVLGPAAPVVAVAGEDVVLPCYLKPNISAEDMSVEWTRTHATDTLVHLYQEREIRNDNQNPSYRGRTALFPEELKRGNISLRLSSVRVSDEGEYTCLVQETDLYKDASIPLQVRAELFPRTHAGFVVVCVLFAVAAIVIAVLSFFQSKLKQKRGHPSEALEWETARRFAVDVTLDPDSAHLQLIVSEDGKQVKCGNTRQKLPDNPKRFDLALSVLGKEGFSSGRFYYEVGVREKTAWTLGVTKEKIDTKNNITRNPENGFWIMRLRNGTEYTAVDETDAPLSLGEKPRIVGVYVDYEMGQVSFYNVEAGSHIHSFTGYTFTEKLYPYLSPSSNENDRNVAPLIISPVRLTD